MKYYRFYYTVTRPDGTIDDCVSNFIQLEESELIEAIFGFCHGLAAQFAQCTGTHIEEWDVYVKSVESVENLGPSGPS